MVTDESECFKVDLNEIIRKYYIFDDAAAKLQVAEETIEIQAIAYEKAVD